MTFFSGRRAAVTQTDRIRNLRRIRNLAIGQQTMGRADIGRGPLAPTLAKGASGR